MLNRLLELEPARGTLTAADIRRWRKTLLGCRDDILAALEADTGKDSSEGFLFEWMPVESALDFLESNIERVMRPHVISSALKTILGRRMLVQRRLPLGHVLVVGTWNFPLSLHLTQILFAAACGNRVTFKPSPYGARLGQVLSQVLPTILGSDRFRVWVPEQDSQLIDAIKRRDYDLVIFTGGTSAARVFAQACAAAMIPFVAEASGSEVAVVLERALRSPADVLKRVDQLLWATFHHTGQTCVSPRFWFVPKSKLNAVWAQATGMLDQFPEALRTRSKLQHSRVEAEHAAWEQWAQALPGAEKCVSQVRPEFMLFKLNSFKDLPADSPGNFGPAAIVVPYESLESVVEWNNRSPWSLLTTIFGEPDSAELRSLSGFDTTIVSIDEAVIAAGDAAIPFGGRGASGYGVCHGIDGLMAVSRVQTWQQVAPWPGSALVKAVPSWASLVELRRIGGALKEMDKNPMQAVKRFFS